MLLRGWGDKLFKQSKQDNRSLSSSNIAFGFWNGIKYGCLQKIIQIGKKYV